MGGGVRRGLRRVLSSRAGAGPGGRLREGERTRQKEPDSPRRGRARPCIEPATLPTATGLRMPQKDNSLPARSQPVHRAASQPGKARSPPGHPRRREEVNQTVGPC